MKIITFLIVILISKNLYSADTETLPQLIGNDLLSPVTDINRNYYLYGAGGILLSEIFLQKFEKNFQKDIVNHKPLGSTSKYGDLIGQGIPNAIYFLGMEAAGEGHLAGLMLRSTLISGLTTNVLKYSIREKRPDSSSKNSFPSGHSTTAFAFASVVATEHGISYGIPSYVLATFVGFSRINDNKHYLFDVLAGALMGTMYGQSICHRDTKETITYNFVPVLSHEELGINFHVSY
jgi:membrane-associated phospholipid phosphatase